MVRGCEPTSLHGRNCLVGRNWHRQQRNLLWGLPALPRNCGGRKGYAGFPANSSMPVNLSVSRKPRAKAEQGKKMTLGLFVQH